MRFEGVGSFSIVKWAPFQLSKFGKCGRSGPLFDCQMGPFSVDKNISLLLESGSPAD